MCISRRYEGAQGVLEHCASVCIQERVRVHKEKVRWKEECVWERKDQGEVLLFFYTIFSIFFIIFLFSEEADPTRLIIMMYIHYLF